MKKQLLIGAFFLGSLMTVNAQQVLFEDSFESYNDFIFENIGEYTLIDGDGAPTYSIDGVTFENQAYTGSYIVFNPSQTSPALGDAWAPHTGSKMAVCFNAVVGGDPQGPNDDWLVSPQITLSDTGNTLTFWAKSITDQFGLERFSVAVSTSGTAVADFTVISEGAFVEAPTDWTEYSFSLDAYANQSVYVAIHCTSNDAFAFFVDDLSVTADGVASIDNHLSSQFSVSPNPATNIINIKNAENTSINKVVITDINGRTVKSVELNGTLSEVQVNVSDIESGMYIMSVSSDRGTVVKKIIKK